MTSDEYKSALETLGLTQGQAGTLLGVTRRTSLGYATGEHRIPEAVAKLLQVYLTHAEVHDKLDLFASDHADIKARLAALEQKGEQ